MHIIMNPPYDKNLHLKILREAMKHSDDIVNLSPADGFINMNIKTKLNAEIAPYIDSMDVISEKDAGDFFGIYISSKLGIMHILKNGAKGYEVDNKHLESICKKLRSRKSIRSAINSYDDAPEKPFIRIEGDYGYAKGWHYTLEEIFASEKVTAKIVFNTEAERDNFVWTTINTWPYKLMYKIDDNAAVIAHMPWLGDYTHKWTDDMLYKYFGLTDDEIKIIEEEIKCIL